MQPYIDFSHSIFYYHWRQVDRRIELARPIGGLWYWRCWTFGLFSQCWQEHTCFMFLQEASNVVVQWLALLRNFEVPCSNLGLWTGKSGFTQFLYSTWDSTVNSATSSLFIVCNHLTSRCYQLEKLETGKASLNSEANAYKEVNYKLQMARLKCHEIAWHAYRHWWMLFAKDRCHGDIYRS
jgi:hypothetical protein